MLYFRTETIGVENLLLLIAPPNWATPVTGEFAARTAGDSGLSNRSHRRRTAAQTVLTLNWTMTALGEEAVRLRALLRVYDNQPLLVPFWPADMLLTELPASQWTSGDLRLFYEPDGSQIQVVTNGASTPAFTPTINCRTAPLLWGRFAKQPAAPEADNAVVFDQPFSVVECGPAEYAVRAVATLTNGPAHGTVTPRLLDIRANWRGAVASGGVELRVQSERIGYGRAQVEYYVSHSPSRRVKVSVTPIEDEIVRLVALFQDRGGSAGLVWMPGQWHDTTLAAASLASGSGSSNITINDATALGGEYGVLLDDGVKLAARRINVVSGNILTLNAAPGVFAAGTPLAALLLCRWQGDVLRLQWVTPVVAEAALELVELPAEARLAAGETQGGTIGDLGGIWWGYVVTDGTVTWRFTSHDAPISAGVLGTFTPRPIDHGDITQELNLAKHSVNLKAGHWAGSPFERWRADRNAPALRIQIYEGSTAAPAAAKVIYTGTATAAKYIGAAVTLSINGPTTMLDLKGPVAINSTRCWVPFGGSMCGMDVGALSIDAQLIAAASAEQLTFVDSATSTWPVLPRDYYRHGYLERTLPDGTLRRIRIVASDPVRDESLPPIVTLDPAAAAWEARVLANGGTFAADSLALCNYFATALRGCAAYDKILYLNPFLGGNLAAALVPLIDRLSWPAPTVVGLTDNDVGDALGIRNTGDASRSIRFVLPAAVRPRDIGLGMWMLDGDFYVIGQGAGNNQLAATSSYAQYAGSNRSNLRAVGTGGNWAHAHWFGFDAAALPYGSLYRNGNLLASGARSATSTALESHYLFGLWGYDIVRLGISYVTSGALSDAEVAELHNAIESALMVPSGRTGSVERSLTVKLAQRVPDLPSTFPAAGWRLVPGCDKSIDNCGRYANRHRFRGFPHLPKSNPALVPVKQETGSGGKK